MTYKHALDFSTWANFQLFHAITWSLTASETFCSIRSCGTQNSLLVVSSLARTFMHPIAEAGSFLVMCCQKACLPATIPFSSITTLVVSSIIIDGVLSPAKPKSSCYGLVKYTDTQSLYLYTVVMQNIFI